MTTYTISNRDSGATVWTGEAETAKGALEAMASDAGYSSYSEACMTTEGSGDYDLVKRSSDAWECGRLTITADALLVPRLVPPIPRRHRERPKWPARGGCEPRWARRERH